MRKLISICMAAIMSISILLIPATAFAATDNDITRIRKVKDEASFDTTLVFEDFDETSEQVIELILTNAKWREADLSSEFETHDSETRAYVTFTPVDDKYRLALPLIADGEGEAKIRIEAIDSSVTEGSYTIAEIVDTNTAITIEEKTPLKEGATEIDTIIVEETVPGSIKENATLKLKLDTDFEWTTGANFSIEIFPSSCGLSCSESDVKIEDEELIIPLSGSTTSSKAAIFIKGLEVNFDSDDVDYGTECEVTISGNGFTKQSVLVGTTTDYDVNIEIEDEKLPVFISGRADDTETLELTIKEVISDSWTNGKRTKVTFPKGVEVIKVNEKSIKNGTFSYDIDENEVELNITAEKDKKLSVTFNFELSISPEFTGDIEAIISGKVLDDDYVATVGKAIFPVEVKAEQNIFYVDYKNSEASDIIITEVEVGMLEKHDIVMLEVEGVQFEDEPTVTVEGDLEIDNIKVKGNVISFRVDSESVKKAGVITISDIELYVDRNLPYGNYDLFITTSKDDNIDAVSEIKDVKNAIIKNYSKDKDEVSGLFDCDKVVTVKDYIVRTANKDVFTDKLIVVIGANKMMSGSKEIALDVPAYISNDRTMLPVRAITEALSDSAVVAWNDATKTVTILFGNRVISMTIGSNIMYINGVALPMTAAPEITNSRTFLPLRDLGYALGLNDDKINWDDITKTVTLN